MLYLLAVSILWGFSFGLIKAEFSGLSPATLAAARLFIALPCFLPFLKPRFRRVSQLTLRFLAIGAVQYGIMYVCLFSSFKWLNGYEVALLTIFTPLYVVIAHGLLRRTWPPAWFWCTAALAVVGALVIFQPDTIPTKWPGILLMQVANACFALGQIAWKQLQPLLKDNRPADGYAWLYLGGFLAALPFALFQNPFAGLAELQSSQWIALLYLGAIASGLGFFLWNIGAARTHAASLAVFNNLKIPVAILISLTIFQEEAELKTLVPGLIILLLALGWAEWSHKRHQNYQV